MLSYKVVQFSGSITSRIHVLLSVYSIIFSIHATLLIASAVHSVKFSYYNAQRLKDRTIFPFSPL